jgi:hypothetical protein
MLMLGLGTLGVGLAAYGASKVPNMVREGILSEGPNDPDDPKNFNLNPFQKLLVDEKSLRPQYFKRQRNTVYKDKDVRDRIDSLGLSKTDIGERGTAEFLADTKKDYNEFVRKEDLINSSRSIKGFSDYLGGRGPNDLTLDDLSKKVRELSEKDPLTAIGARALQNKRTEVETNTEQERYEDRLTREQKIFAAQQAQQNLTNQMQLNQIQSAREERRFDREDRKEERELRREDSRRKEQQQMMLMLMRGLQQGLGSLN